MGELTDRIVDLGELLGAEALLLAEQLDGLGSWAERFELVDDFFARGLARTEAVAPALVWAWRRLEETGGTIAVGALAEELGWSRKRLAAAFRDEIGLPPKPLPRV
jgi:hypothetical protein